MEDLTQEEQNLLAGMTVKEKVKFLNARIKTKEKPSEKMAEKKNHQQQEQDFGKNMFNMFSQEMSDDMINKVLEELQKKSPEEMESMIENMLEGPLGTMLQENFPLGKITTDKKLMIKNMLVALQNPVMAPIIKEALKNKKNFQK